MGNIMDYISWRGDLTFAQSPFNEVDNLILACFSYVNLDRIPAVTRQKGIELKKLVKEFKKLHTIKELEADKSFIRLAPFMMFEMAKSVRFGNCVIRNYVNEIVTEAEQQFSAVDPHPNFWSSFRKRLNRDGWRIRKVCMPEPPAC